MLSGPVREEGDWGLDAQRCSPGDGCFECGVWNADDLGELALLLARAGVWFGFGC